MAHPEDTSAPATPDQLLVSESGAATELTDKALEGVAGGGKAITQDVTVNKAKTADKAFQAMDGYIRG
jgi:hypothetical protein